MKASKLNPKSPHYEFGGPIGCLLVLVGCPTMAYALVFGCGKSGCPPAWSTFRASLHGTRLFDLEAMILYIEWIWGLIVLWFLLPGASVEGNQLRNGKKVAYKMNGFASLALIMGLISFGYLFHRPLVERTSIWIFDHYLGLVTASLIASFALSIFVYVYSFYMPEDELLALGGNTGNHLHDFFIGRPLNPSVGTFEIKSFAELRPGMILWCVLDLAFAFRQHAVYGRFTDSMLLVCGFQIYYVADALWYESAILTQMDIATDGFGYMLAFGDLVWVPMVYSLQVRFLASHPVWLGYLGTIAVLSLNVLGYYVFRGANGQKNRFRRNPEDPTVAHLSYLDTKSGSRLLTSGWWGWSRHMNYLGDLIMALAWCLTTGFTTPITYFYLLYFMVLLIHRQRRDDALCRTKYGTDWDKYTSMVPWRILPYVY